MVKKSVQEKNRSIVMGSLVAVIVVALFASIVTFIVRSTDEAKLEASASRPTYVTTNEGVSYGDVNAPVEVSIYEDLMCPGCAFFTDANGADLGELIDNGDIKVVWHPMVFLDAQSQGSQYSSRAANAVIVVSDEEPQFVHSFMGQLYANQPSEGTKGLSDDEIGSIALKVGVSQKTVDMFAAHKYFDWLQVSQAQSYKDGIQATPTILIDGELYLENWAEPGALKGAILKAIEEK